MAFSDNEEVLEVEIFKYISQHLLDFQVTVLLEKHFWPSTSRGGPKRPSAWNRVDTIKNLRQNLEKQNKICQYEEWSPEVFCKIICSYKSRTFQHRCFPVNIAKFLRALILKNVCKRLRGEKFERWAKNFVTLVP